MSSSTTPSFSSFSFPDSDEEDQVLSEQEKEVEDEKDKMIKNTKEEEKAKLEDIPKEKGKEKEKEEKSDVLRVAEYSREIRRCYNFPQCKFGPYCYNLHPSNDICQDYLQFKCSLFDQCQKLHLTKPLKTKLLKRVKADQKNGRVVCNVYGVDNTTGQPVDAKHNSSSSSSPQPSEGSVQNHDINSAEEKASNVSGDLFFFPSSVDRDLTTSIETLSWILRARASPLFPLLANQILYVLKSRTQMEPNLEVSIKTVSPTTDNPWGILFDAKTHRHTKQNLNLFYMLTVQHTYVVTSLMQMYKWYRFLDLIDMTIYKTDSDFPLATIQKSIANIWQPTSFFY